MARWMARLDWRARLAWWPAQSPGLIEALGLSRAEADAAAWAVLPDGSRHSGAVAVAAALDQLLPGSPAVCATLVRLPVLRRLTARAYAWVALNRHRAPGSAVCQAGQSLPQAPAAVLAEARRRQVVAR